MTCPRRRAKDSWPASTWTWRATPISNIWPAWLREARCRRRQSMKRCGGFCESSLRWVFLIGLMLMRRTPLLLSQTPTSAQPGRLRKRVLCCSRTTRPVVVRTVALIGPLADSRRDMLGAWSAQGKPEDVVTLRAALEARAQRDGFRLVYAKGTEIRGTSDSGFAEAVAAASQADVVLLALGEDAQWMTGEAGSRAFIDLPGNQQQLLEKVVATGKPSALILFSGRPLALTPVVSSVQAILEAWSPGVQAGPALERVLFGDVSPAGRLTVTFPRSLGQVPIYHSVLNTGRPPVCLDLPRPPTNGEEKYRSRYTDEQNTPLYPFGFGLTYTTFEYSAPQVSVTSADSAALNGGRETLRITAEVKNTGSRAGEEVVQLYIGLRGTSVARPVRQLKGYRRLALGPGESRKVEFTLGRDELSIWQNGTSYAVEPGELRVWIAPNAQAGMPATVTLK